MFVCSPALELTVAAALCGRCGAAGRLSWDTSLNASQVHSEWVARTFGLGLPPAAQASLGAMLDMSQDAANLLGFYRGYRGLWYKFQGDGLRSSPVNGQVLTPHGAGMPPSAAAELLHLYSPGVQRIYSNHSDPRTEVALLEFGQFALDYRLTNGRTLIEDMLQSPVEGLNLTRAMQARWAALEQALAPSGNYWNATAGALGLFVRQSTVQASRLATALGKLHAH